ncbi:MAG: transposase [Verrucomicrobia bacterium]|nr:transposase [Verrucomicrobiota bacterium]
MNATKRSKRTRRKYTGEFKAKVALEAIKAQETINQIAARHEVHPHFSIRQQCGLWGLHRSGLYYEPVPESAEWLRVLEGRGIRVSLDGRGRAFDNIFIERLWRTVKWEHVFLYEHRVLQELRGGLGNYFWYYNRERWHSALENQPPAAVYER